jgi:hypothetical protein
MGVSKQIKVREQVSFSLMFQFTNILNHFQPANPTVSIDSLASFGVVTNNTTNPGPRKIQFGMRITF